MQSDQKIIIKFDWYCNLCSFWIKYIIKKDPNCKINYSNNNKTNSIVVISNDITYYESEAIIKILEYINFNPTIIYILKVTPKTLLNYIYNFVSKYRYAIFGKRRSCYIPNKEN